MDFSSVWNIGTLVVSGISALGGGAIGMFVRGIDARRKLAELNRELEQAREEAQRRHATAVRAARGAAFGLEGFAHACHALVVENARARRAGEPLTFELPELARRVQTGNSPEALELESAYRDLEQRVRSANEHVEEVCRDDYHAGHEEGLDVLEARAFETAAEALKLAARYRHRFGVARGPLGRREQLIEDEIMARAAEEDAALPGDH
ncbi:hypothetical protein [Burkholderia multivorans]|uniref:hypothetical protein n=1 Tax=Burkholderia multivorans TaxID=87883 RepID=UPI001589481F|nr:hypothetical protein [Burkholderia multivorans]MBR8048873.1 hypothetical protein [Burkholderia multivorans]MBY4672216.1 hypothetical protein [Burkholderia multivorans]MDR8876571.1 hypothetical protein [Burkholderia multivorans]MDR8882400.1 hypothetical protein [Burkholderia multivorans]MDR8888760.1 hypothetical protein [Burkholderia multivorans]